MFPGNQNWPVSPKFWGVMDGMLTPTGSAQVNFLLLLILLLLRLLLLILLLLVVLLLGYP